MSTEDIVVGDGPVLSAGDTAVLQFTVADWTTGRVLARVQGGQAAVRGQIDLGQVIPGWWQGMPGMRVGGRRALTLIPEMVVGPLGAPPEVFNNLTYYYVVDLLRVEPLEPLGPPPFSGPRMSLTLLDDYAPFG
jgi:peptidylprolyl isomerase